MSPGDIIALLAFAQGYGVPKATQAKIDAWHHALHQIDFDEAQAAVVLHYRESAADVKPADIWSRCRVPEAPAAPAPAPKPRDPERWHRMWRGALAEAAAGCSAWRAAVLSRPEAAARLCQPPLDYQAPGQWDGFIPPELFNGERNDSPRRAALMAIMDDALAAGGAG